MHLPTTFHYQLQHPFQLQLARDFSLLHTFGPVSNPDIMFIGSPAFVLANQRLFSTVRFTGYVGIATGFFSPVCIFLGPSLILQGVNQASVVL